MGKTAREVMTGGAECIGESDSILDAAKRLAQGKDPASTPAAS